jgi:hypothetical protein
MAAECSTPSHGSTSIGHQLRRPEQGFVDRTTSPTEASTKARL